MSKHGLFARPVLGLALALAAVQFAGDGRSSDFARGHWPTAVTFEGVPPRAQPKPGSACEVANQYVTFINTDQAPKVPGLFADDGEFIGVEDRVLHGRAEIATFYNVVHQRGAIPLSFIDEADNCIMELAGARPGPQPGGPSVYKLVAIDHFTVDANHRIKRLVIFFRPGSIQPQH